MFKNQSCLKSIRYFLTKNPIHKILSVLFIVAALGINAATYYVSSSGNDSNSGTSENQAWKSLTKVNSFTPRPGDQILFRRGDAWVGTLTVRASGSSGNPIVYGAYGSGNKPIIYGSEQITGWTLHSGNIYKATVSNPVTQLFLNEVKMKAARYPNSGYATIDAVNGSTSFTCNALNSGINYGGAIWVGRTIAFAMETFNVVGSSGKTLSISGIPVGKLGKTNGFFLVNKLEFLDSPGEWYYDSSAKTIYFWTPNGNSPANYFVRGSSIDNGAIVENKTYFHIENMDFRHHKKNGLHLSGDNFTISNNDISYPDIKGIEIAYGSNNTISNNTINGATHDGIFCHTAYSIYKDNRISNTFMFDNFGVTGSGETWWGGSGMFVEGNDNVIQYNRIVNSGYNGIQFARRNRVENNYINNVCLVKDDGGGIYTAGSGAYPNASNSGSVIRGNIIDNVPGTTEGWDEWIYSYGVGVYLDEYCGNILIENNTILNCSQSCIYNHSSYKITIRNNTAVNARSMISINNDGRETEVTNNIMYAMDKCMENKTTERLVSQKNSNAKFNSNLYINHYRSMGNFTINESNSFDFIGWKAQTGQDLNSYCDNSPLAAGEKEEIFYNDTKQTKSFSLGGYVYRDIYGTELTSLTLEPFTSKILIKTTKIVSGTNKNPVIQNQTISTSGGKQVGEFVGQVVASDPDAGQTLNYKIVQDNSGGYFAINASNGNLVANKPFPISGNHVVELRVSVTDNAPAPLSASANITINITESSANQSPVIQDQTIATIGGKKVGEFIGQVVASDPDVSQTLNYTIVEDNSGGYFAINASDGKLSANKPFPTSGDHSVVLRVTVTDNSSSPLSASANITVNVTNSDVSSNYSEYLMEEPSGSLVYDSQGTNHGTIMNSVIRTFGVKGSGIGIDGTNYINLGQVFGDNVTDEVSISAWIKPMIAYGDWQAIIVHGGPNFNTFGLYIRPSSREIGFKTTGTTNDVFTTTAGGKLWDGNWHQLTATYDGTKKVIYLDGVIIRSINAYGNIDSGEGYNLSIGAVTEQASPSSIYYGYIDEVRIFNYVLGTLEVNDLYASINNLKGAEIPGADYADVETLRFIGSNNNERDITVESTFETSDENEFHVYPNPATSYVQIDYSLLPELETQIIIVDGTGRSVLNKMVESTVTKIDVSSLSPGMYYVKSVNQQSSTVKKLIINN